LQHQHMQKLTSVLVHQVLRVLLVEVDNKVEVEEAIS
jgi:hypothetical protein